jgi:hypothetical protein
MDDPEFSHLLHDEQDMQTRIAELERMAAEFEDIMGSD